MSLSDDMKSNGFISQLVQRISNIEEFVRKHQSVQHDSIPVSGWIPFQGTLTYSSADSPTFVISADSDLTGILSVGMRIKLDQSSTLYFGVTGVGSFSGGATLVTLFGGTGSGAYTLTNAAISNAFYSSEKEPFGFPADESIWRVVATDTTNLAQALPAANTYYNFLSISLPIGQWDVGYQTNTEVTITTAAVTNIGLRTTLSTANNSASDGEFTSSAATPFPIVVSGTSRYHASRKKTLTLVAKTTYYLNALVSSAATSLNMRGDIGSTMIVARWTGL